MSVFKATKVVNVMYVVGILSIAIFNNFIQINPESSLGDRFIVVFSVLGLSIPNLALIRALPPVSKMMKTTVLLNVICILLFVAGVLAHQQEMLVMLWSVTVVSICSINAVVLVSVIIANRRLKTLKESEIQLSPDA
ncbi:MAG: hypothetical protein VYA55_16135 [Pseudomonadota bacterium]|nr:hypothetical protein [Pseudomonadota bacterium]